ncbi:hypothetical protein BP6252_07827 [Coleophoma cylindrospora]|uniref:Uncharacterized protein n=1 Tax=Coleophoma cylindrospora TaxID=1849047 RepID=A0A3D8RBM5_9HELO|nr:hypothetical protein BP6252_07827 [Coleophoma cylindrospora]
MSLFSRRCLFKHRSSFNTTETLNALFALKTTSRPRLFSITARQSAASTTVKHKAPKVKQTSISKLRISSTKNASQGSAIARPAYQSYAAQLAQKSSPVLLYQAPSHTLYKISCYGGSVFCFVYAAWNFNAHYLNADPGLAPWVPIAFGGICFLMAGVGGWLVLGPARIVHKITAVPQKAVSANGQPSLMIEVELRKMFPIPFFSARKLLVKPDEVKLPNSFSPIVSRKSASELAAERKAAEQKLKEFREYEDTHVMTRPFRHMKQGAGEFFQALRQAWTREGFWSLGVKEQRYKLDVSRGWVLDGGRALERVLTVDKRLS